jgi:hypothetical protein
MHTKLMTPQLILSAVTSTLAANNLQALPKTLAALTVVVAIVCTVLGAITNFVEFNVVSKDTASQQRDTDRFTDIWEVSILSMT